MAMKTIKNPGILQQGLLHLGDHNRILVQTDVRTGFTTPFWLRPAAVGSAYVELHRHIYMQYAWLAFGLCSQRAYAAIVAVALLGSAHLARARADTRSYETSSMHFCPQVLKFRRT
jgi:hypothetical protein